MERLHIALLGTFQVTGDDGPITDFEADSARALLAYLAMHAGAAFPRTALAALLWPDQPEADALHALRQALNRLRRAIGDAEADPPFLTITRTDIGFNPHSRYRLDVATFRDLVAACKQHPHRRLHVCRTCRERLSEAAALYRGDLLAGFFLDSPPFEEWLLLEREALHRQAIEVLDALATCHEERGEWDAVQRYARRQVELEPWREEAHQQLIRALALSGQRSAALAQYHACRRILAAELGVEPAASTEALRRQIEDETLAPPPQPPYNLPVQLTPFIGRTAELAQVAERLNRPDCRLLTLVGPGGVGKTRLALQAAGGERGAFRDGIYFVSLAAAHATDPLGALLAQALGVNPRPGEDLNAQLVRYLKDKEMLLVLDNLERLGAGGELIVDLLQRAPDVRLLTTSQRPLNIVGEWVFNVRPLDCPPDDTVGDKGDDYSAVQFFRQSALRRQPDFALSPANRADVVRICRLLGGIPLALELAAGWLHARSCEEIARAIQHDLDFLRTASPGVDERHRSIRAALDYSWGLLTAAEQAALRRLAVFPAGFGSEAALHVAETTEDVLASLVDKSMLQQVTYESPRPATRYWMHNLMRRYAMERLVGEPDDAFAAHQRHCDFYCALLAGLEGDLTGRSPRRALEILDDEVDNIRAAWEWAVAQEDVPQIERALEGLTWFYILRGRFQEGEAVLGRAAESLGQGGPAAERLTCKLAVRRGVFLGHLGRYDEAEAVVSASLQSLQEFDDVPGVVLCLATLSWAHSRRGNYAQARDFAIQALTLAQTHALRHLEADSLNHLGSAYVYLEDFAQAQDCYNRSLHIRRELGDRWGESVALGNLGVVAYEQSQFQAAHDCFAQALEIIRRDIGSREREAWCLTNLGMTALEYGDYAASLDYYQQALCLGRETGNLWETSNTLSNLGYTCWALGDFAHSEEYYAEAIQTKQEIGDRRGAGLTLALYGLLLHALGRDAEALRVGEEALAVAGELGSAQVQAYALTCIGQAQVGLGRLAEAADAYRRALALRRELGQESLAVELSGALASIALLQGDLVQAQSLADDILRYLERGSLDGALDPFGVYLTCYRVLQADRRLEAGAVLETAYRALQERAGRIPDEALRRSFLENVASHAQIVQEWEKGIKHQI
ncbi:MAG: tetratricopeptide repeat protein [Thermoflexales bacterium]|nr:tetratricopeptide repeat protein [Thermoflexales bacterium]